MVSVGYLQKVRPGSLIVVMHGGNSSVFYKVTYPIPLKQDLNFTVVANAAIDLMTVYTCCLRLTFASANQIVAYKSVSYQQVR